MRNLIWMLPALLIAMQFPAKADTVLPGTQIAVRTERPIDVNQWDRGRIYRGFVARDVVARDGDVAIPEGSPAELIVRQIGPNEMTIDIESVTVNGRRYVMDNTGPEFNAQTYNNGNGVLGAIIGAIAGATGAQVETQGSEIRVPPGTVLRFELQQPLRVVGWQDPGYQRNGIHYHHDHDWYR
ncbi:MAG TPA: hypothetical protein VEV17_10605 [Bryobacteraceae bacterium]|nr:hypothetical protein [Bryobacteraceae bacterium]